MVIQPEIPVKQLKNLNTVPSSKLLYHRLDLLGQPNACLHFKQLATLGKALVVLLDIVMLLGSGAAESKTLLTKCWKYCPLERVFFLQGWLETQPYPAFLLFSDQS